MQNLIMGYLLSKHGRRAKMKNILMVCADKDFRKDLSKALASELKCLYLDADELLDFEILNRQEIKLNQASDALQQMELDTLKRIAEFKNCIITISNDLFVSNDNFQHIKDVVKVYVELSKAHLVAKSNKQEMYKLEQQLVIYDEINRLIKANCDFCVIKDIKTIEQLCQEIIVNYRK